MFRMLSSVLEMVIRLFDEKQKRRQRHKKKQRITIRQSFIIMRYHIKPNIYTSAVDPAAKNPPFVKNKFHPFPCPDQIDPIKQKPKGNNRDAKIQSD